MTTRRPYVALLGALVFSALAAPSVAFAETKTASDARNCVVEVPDRNSPNGTCRIETQMPCQDFERYLKSYSQGMLKAIYGCAANGNFSREAAVIDRKVKIQKPYI